jgi:hypothetical protein
MKLIDRYIYAVTEHLPIDTREDVSKELRANIEDMLPESPNEHDIRAVLEKLGSPSKLAEDFAPTKRYLIGPSLYASYFSVLKLVIGIVVIVLASITLIDKLLNPSDSINYIKMSVEIITDMIVAVIQGATQAFLWVTITFIILERTGVNAENLPFQETWSIDNLPTLPIPKKKMISRVETAVSMFFAILFISLFYFEPQLIGWYEKGKDGLRLIESFFVVERLHFYMPIIILLAIFQFGIFIYKFISRRWSRPLAIVNTINNIAISILVCIMASDSSLFNNGFVSRFSNLLDSSISQLKPIWNRSIWVFVIVFVSICIWDSISGFIKCNAHD